MFLSGQVIINLHTKKSHNNEFDFFITTTYI